jgi:hypothetical protein
VLKEEVGITLKILGVTSVISAVYVSSYDATHVLKLYLRCSEYLQVKEDAFKCVL